MISKILSVLIGYCLGCFLTAVVVAKRFTGKDISEIGTGNPGMANVMARIGKKPGFIVLAGDILKTVIAMVLSAMFFQESLGTSMAFLYAGFGTLLGHNFPIQRKFKGGKGVTVTCTWIILLLPFSGILCSVGGGVITVLTGLLPLGAVLITFFFIPFCAFELGTQAMVIMIASFMIMLFKHFKGFIAGFKDKEHREFNKKRSAKSIVLSVVIFLLVYAIGFGRYYLTEIEPFVGIGPVIEEQATEDSEADFENEETLVEDKLSAQEDTDESIKKLASEKNASKLNTEDENASNQAPSENYYDIKLTFAGDINFDENWSTTKYMDSTENGITDCIDSRLIDVMKEADVMWINNEFTYSNRGNPLANKAYTFRANTDRVENLKTLGVDIVGLANNHVYDYGAEALIDTLDTLDNADIPYVGAGRNLEEAMEPYYFEIDGIKIAYVAASRAEKNKMTPQATEDSPGILRCYDTALFDEEIAKAKENADFVIACVHWGTEYSTELQQVQLDTAKEYLDAGADAIIGAHTHCLQGFEYYDGKPVVFSLGNFWFNEKTLDTMLLTLEFYKNESGEGVKMSITPALQQNCTTTYVSGTSEQRELYDRLESISINVSIDDDGSVNQKDLE